MQAFWPDVTASSSAGQADSGYPGSILAEDEARSPSGNDGNEDTNEAIDDRSLVCSVCNGLFEAGLHDPEGQFLFGEEFAALEEIGADRMHPVGYVCRQPQ